LKWDDRTGSRLENFAAFLIAGIALLAFLGALSAAAEELHANAVPFFEDVPALSEGDLSLTRGGAVLPGGMSVEISGLSRVMVDGEDLALSSVASSLPLGLESGTWATFADSGAQALSLPMVITNSESAISIGQFREINIEIRNVPISLEVAPAFPSEVYTPSLLP